MQTENETQQQELRKKRAEIAGKSLSELVRAIKAMPQDQVVDYIETTVCAGIGLMRSGAGDEYVRGFLQGALADLDKPSVTYRAPNTH